MSEPLKKLKKVYPPDLLKQATALQVMVYRFLDGDFEQDADALTALEECSNILSFNVKKFVKSERE